MSFDGNMVFLVVTFEEAHILVIHAELLELLQVLVHSMVVDADSHQRTVGRNDYSVGRSVLELQIWHTEGMILIILGIVKLVVGRLRNTPRHLLRRIADKGPLGTDGETVSFIHQRMLVGRQEDKRHKVLE